MSSYSKGRGGGKSGKSGNRGSKGGGGYQKQITDYMPSKKSCKETKDKSMWDKTKDFFTPKSNNGNSDNKKSNNGNNQNKNNNNNYQNKSHNNHNHHNGNNHHSNNHSNYHNKQSNKYSSSKHNSKSYSSHNKNNKYGTSTYHNKHGSATAGYYNDSSSDDGENNYKLYPLPCKSQKRWQKIVTVLSRPMNNATDLIKALYDVSGDKQKSQLSTKGLRILLETYMTTQEQQRFYKFTLPFIKECALNLYSLFPAKEISLLHEGQNATVELTEEQVCSLLAMSFFGLHTWERGTYFPRFRITNLFGYQDVVYFEKLKCILNYFYILAAENKQKKIQNNNYNNKTPKRTISIYRHIPNKLEYGKLQNKYLSQNVTNLCKFEFHISGSIEDCDNGLQIDFANKYIGGGVLGSGCVQEEIRFLINPECLVSLLLCQCMKPNEAIAVVGTRQFSKYKGYGSSFQFNGRYDDTTIDHYYGDFYKKRNCIIAIDAEKFYHNQLYLQYYENKMKRELLKAYTGFSVPTDQTNLNEKKENSNKLWIATGNWGCGVFGGDIELKCILQWMAASLANRNIKYFAFGDKGCKYMESFVDIIEKNNITVGGLWQYLCKYSKYRKDAYQHHPNNIDSVFLFIVKQINKNNKNNNNHKFILKPNHSLANKKQNDVDPGHHEEKKQFFKRKKVNNDVNKMEADTYNNNNNNYNNNNNNDQKQKNTVQQGMSQRSDSFDDNMLDTGDNESSCGLEADDDKKKKNNMAPSRGRSKL